MTAVPLALLLVATLAVLVAVTPGAFSFDRWPDAPRASLSEREVVVEVPVKADSTARADARRKPAVEREGSTVLVRAPQRRPLERPQAPAASPVVPQVVAEAAPELQPHAEGDGSLPAAEDEAPEVDSPAPLPLPELPAAPELPAKELPDEPDPSVPEWDDDFAATYQLQNYRMPSGLDCRVRS